MTWRDLMCGEARAAHVGRELTLAGAAWSGAFGLFAVLYFRPLALPRR